MRQPTHPGEVLKEDVFPAMQLSASKAAGLLHISRQYMSDMLNARKPLTALLCLKISKLAGNSAEFWMNMQTRYNLWDAAHDPANQKILAEIPTFDELNARM